MKITTTTTLRTSPKRLRELKMNAVGKKTRAMLDKRSSASESAAHSNMVDAIQTLSRFGGPVVGAAVGLIRTGGLSLPWVAAGVVGGVAGSFLAQDLMSSPPVIGDKVRSSNRAASQAMNDYKDGLLATADDTELSTVVNDDIWQTRRVHGSLNRQLEVLEELNEVVENRNLPGWKGQLANASHHPQLHSFLIDSIERTEQPEKYTQMFVEGIEEGFLTEDEVATKVLKAVEQDSRT